MKEFATDRLELLKERSFSEVFDDFGLFVRKHGVSLLRAFVMVPGPFILVAGVLNAYPAVVGSEFGGMGPGMFLYLLLMIISALAASIFSIATVVLFMKGVEKGKELDIAELRSEVMKSFFPLLGAILAWALILFSSLLAIFFLGFLLLGGLGVVGGPLALVGVFLFIILIYFGFVPLAVFLVTVTFFQMLREDRSFGASFGRSFTLMKKVFWRTWSIMVLGGLLFVVLSLACFIPQLAVGFGYGLLSPNPGYEQDGLLLFQTMSLIGYVASTFVTAFFNVLVGLHYYSLHESESGEGLEERISSELPSGEE